MTLADYLFWSLRHCRKRLFESALIVLAVGLGVGVVISVLALFDGVRHEQEQYLKQEQYRTINVRTVEDIRAVFSDAAGPLIAIPDIPTAQVNFGIQDIVNLKAALPQAYVFSEQSGTYPTSLLTQEAPTNQSGNRVATSMSNRITVHALTPDFFGFHGLRAATGTLFMAADVEQATRVMVLGYSLAERLFGDQPAVGQVVPLGSDDQPYTVIGVLQELPVNRDARGRVMGTNYNDRAFVPLTARPVMNYGRSTGGSTAWGGAALGLPADNALSLGEIKVGMTSGRYMGSTLRQTREYIYQTYGDTISVHSAYEAYQEQQNRNLFMGMVVGLFASLGLVIAAINILNLMLARIYRRIRSIGISISMGASRRTVFSQFLIEAAILGLIGAALGLVLSFGGVRLIALIVGEPVRQTITAQIAGIGVALMISLLFGVYPAYQASRINPVDALRVD